MASRLARKTMMYLKNTMGTVSYQPRLVNYSKITPQFVYGYVDVNTNATTPFSRGKVHKGFIAGLLDDNSVVTVDDGDLFLDRYDGYYYFVMSRKGKFHNNQTVYYDATMYRCDITVEIYRFGMGARDTFGRPLQNTPTKLNTGGYSLPVEWVDQNGTVWVDATNATWTLPIGTVLAMSNPLNYDIIQQKDRLVAQNKIEICLQQSVGVQIGDRIVTNKGDQFIVQTIDNTSLTNLVLCGVDTDVR